MALLNVFYFYSRVSAIARKNVIDAGRSSFLADTKLSLRNKESAPLFLFLYAISTRMDH